jgi:hypothetical protein
MGGLMGGGPKKDRKAEAALKQQQRDEKLRIAEEKSDLEQRRARGGKVAGGLIATSERGAFSTGKKKNISGIT